LNKEYGDDEAREDGVDDTQTINLRKIIAFELDSELYGADIDEVAEVMEMVPIMHLPNVPAFILGLINLRGTIVPLIDLRVLFNLNQKAWNNDSRIIIMKGNNFLVGIVADCMQDLLRLHPEAFHPSPPDATRIDTEYFKQVSKVDDRLLIVLDMKKFLEKTARK